MGTTISPAIRPRRPRTRTGLLPIATWDSSHPGDLGYRADISGFGRSLEPGSMMPRPSPTKDNLFLRARTRGRAHVSRRMDLRPCTPFEAERAEDPKHCRYEEAPEPRLRDGDALVKVHAAAITPTELTWNSTWTDDRGKDRRPIVPSFEVSGTVEQIASDGTDLKRGDSVYGLLNFWRDGAAAEYVAVRATDLAPNPKSLDHVQAAAVPLSGL